MALTIPADVLGLIVSGDLDDFTIYTDRFGRKVTYLKSPPKSPPTQLQLGVRTRFTTAQAAYMATTADAKDDWERLTLRANLCMTGQNLFIHVAMMRTYQMLNTLIHQTGVDVTPPDPV